MTPIAIIHLISEATLDTDATQFISVMSTNQRAAHVGFAIDVSDVIAAKCLLAIINDPRLAGLSKDAIHYISMTMLYLMFKAASEQRIVDCIEDFIRYEGEHRTTIAAQIIAEILVEHICPGEWVEIVYRISWLNSFVSRFQAGMEMLAATEEAVRQADDRHLLPGGFSLN